MKTKTQDNHSGNKYKCIFLQLSRLQAFDLFGSMVCDPGNSVHGAVNNMAVEPGHRPGNIIKDDLFGDKKINFINIKFIVRPFVQMLQAI